MGTTIGVNRGAASPYKLNTRQYFVISAPPDGITRWGLASGTTSKLAGYVANGAGKLVDAGGLAPGGGDAVYNFVKKSAGKIINILKDIGSDNGLPLLFRAYLEEIPDFSISSEYAQGGLGGLGTMIASVVGTAAKAAGGVTPNMSLDFQMPQMWKGTKPMTLKVTCLITPDTLAALPAFAPSEVNEANVSPGAKVMNAVLIAIMMASPRQLIGTDDTGAEDIFLAAPPVLDCKIGPFVFPTVRATSVSVTYPNDHVYFDDAGFLAIARVTFSITTSYTFTQEGWNAMRNNILNGGIASVAASTLIVGAGNLAIAKDAIVKDLYL